MDPTAEPEPEPEPEPELKRQRIASETAEPEQKLPRNNLKRKRCKKNRQAMKGTLISSPPTWGQIKNLTNKAENVIESQGVPVTPATMFMAMLAVVSCQSSAVASDTNSNTSK
ncbi:pyrin domain-containing protein 3-like isoform X1 [Sciurus carolinensis]|uniref:pyrin domain-containing protein 3-like isoform X1 n=1 Tax=Sciurus carolinensis TaxID=30640 RepID=UPI001FB227B4|nr:pyrin domain-containing protein 3-like isoform X1 [Sciurus carolinensis]XP_047422478.1 pyrin domain-containing protein 3-like isoform X1 [Sciurus carolinensis]XP_047422479.1 pyrin domain-containing protein 3-like isoform X1 [Sciurus carolinensis]XP_047422480.1 pyrin domain-containing protein 3-like isoform X1 [Sciurus carolinensis]XP_047422481.1 pyrin domain-containing protein 3-like isoform X1 [Sciurus carolinensis]XP_047422482.1 pyrin domain-containing protein 3-like isoform X1 [Sciurus c